MNNSFLILATVILFLGACALGGNEQKGAKKAFGTFLYFAGSVTFFLSILTVGSIQNAL
jgi:hypothetical protein